MKKNGKVVFGVIVIIMLITIFYYVFSHFIDNPFVENNSLLSNTDSQETSNTKKAKDTPKENLPVSSKQMGILPYSKNTKNVGETFEVINETTALKVQCCINNVTFTKEAIETDAVYYAETDKYNPIQFDESYNILNDFKYVSVNITLKNEMDQETEIYLNSFRFVAIDPKTDDCADIYYGGELRGYKTRLDLLTYDKAYARKKILPKEEITINLVFIQRDSDIEKNIPYVKFFATGAVNPEYDKESVYVRLKE